jgi:riboflavin kinase/FMN adenylyltransferase
VHLLGFNGDLYGQLLQVELIDYLREEMKFRDIEALKQQMSADCAQAKEILERLSGR